MPTMKKIGLILRIISYASTVPAIVFFFYFILRSLGDGPGSFSYARFIVAILVLISPVVLNLSSRIIDGTLLSG